jgi:hypothetical protein
MKTYLCLNELSTLNPLMALTSRESILELVNFTNSKITGPKKIFYLADHIIL